MVKYKFNPTDVFTALSQPTRTEIVGRLSKEGPLSISQIKERYDMSLPGILKHVDILENSGLVSCKKEGRTKYCSLNEEAFGEAIEWMLAQKRFWETSLDRLEKKINKK